MRKYAIHRDFAMISSFQPPVNPAMLPAINALLSRQRVLSDDKVSVARRTIAGFDGAGIELLLFEPSGLPDRAPCLVYLHGGGFAVRAAGNHYRLVREYAIGAGCKVVMADYRLAPRHRFPTPAEDAFSAFRWAISNAEAWGVDSGKIAIGGDSAGGCLAAACTLMARDRGIPGPCFQMLIYPVTDRRMQTQSMRRFVDTPMWNARKNQAMWRMYLPGAAAAVPPEYASPMEADSLAGLPDAYIETAQFDCLRDEAIAYGLALRAAGCEVEIHQTRGTVHGFDVVEKSGIVRQCVERRVGALRRAFADR